MTNDGANTLTYDDESKITAVTGSYGSGSYQYDGSGMRVEKTVSSVTTVYIFSGSKARCLRSGGLCGMIAEYASGAAPSSPEKEYIYARGGAPMSSQTRGSPRRQDDPPPNSAQSITTTVNPAPHSLPKPAMLTRESPRAKIAPSKRHRPQPTPKQNPENGPILKNQVA